MAVVGPLIAVLLLQAAAAIAFWRALGWKGVPRSIAFIASISVIHFFAPWMLEPGARRWLTGVWACQLGCKLYDMHLSVRPSDRPTLARYVDFIITPLWMVFHRPPARTKRSRDAAQFVRRAIACGVAVVGFSAIWQ